MSESTPDTGGKEAEREVDERLRYWVHDELTGQTFRSSFRARRDTIDEGDRFEERVVSWGCCVPVDVILRVALVEGGERLTGATGVVIEQTDRERRVMESDSSRG